MCIRIINKLSSISSSLIGRSVKGLQDTSDKISGLGLLPSTSSSINNHDNNNSSSSYNSDGNIIQEFEAQLLHVGHDINDINDTPAIAMMKLDVYIKYIKWMRDR